jgi:ABC-type uncharacterized transport system auxiliary subunit
VTIPRPVALALTGLALTMTLAGCSSAGRPKTYQEQTFEERGSQAQLEDMMEKAQMEAIRQREADTRRIVQDEIARQRRP